MTMVQEDRGVLGQWQAAMGREPGQADEDWRAVKGISPRLAASSPASSLARCSCCGSAMANGTSRSGRASWSSWYVKGWRCGRAVLGALAAKAVYVVVVRVSVSLALSSRNFKHVRRRSSRPGPGLTSAAASCMPDSPSGGRRAARR